MRTLPFFFFRGGFWARLWDFSVAAVMEMKGLAMQGSMDEGYRI